MDLSGRRESSNVQDRRGQSGGGLGNIGGGIGGNMLGSMLSGRRGCGGIAIVAVIAIVVWILGGNPMSVLQGIGGNFGALDGITQTETTSSYKGSEEEEELASFTKKVLASTEDVWSRQFKAMGRTYEPPVLVLYSGSIETGCGRGDASTGPFYCSADEKVYIDLSFYREMKESLGAEGDFAWAYVIAHEVGHHVQNQLGVLGRAHQQMSQLGNGSAEANRVSVQIELQADYLAGVWGHDEQQMFHSMEKGDLEEALSTAQVIGDDYLQKRAGFNDSRQYTHGTSAQRERWFKKGFTTGDVSQGNTFEIDYSRL